MKSDNLLKLTRAIAAQEGFGIPDSRPTRNRNPGDLRQWPGFPMDAGDFTVFPSDDIGWDKLQLDIANHAARWPGQSLMQFIAGNGITAPPAACWTGYAPASDSNDSAGYAEALAAALGCTTATTFSEL